MIYPFLHILEMPFHYISVINHIFGISSVLLWQCHLILYGIPCIFSCAIAYKCTSIISMTNKSVMTLLMSINYLSDVSSDGKCLVDLLHVLQYTGTWYTSRLIHNRSVHVYTHYAIFVYGLCSKWFTSKSLSSDANEDCSLIFAFTFVRLD